MSDHEHFENEVKCYHCGDDCLTTSIISNNKVFCCNGCKTVYEMLNEFNLTEYYAVDQKPGIQPKTIKSNAFDFLDNEQLIDQLLEYNDDQISKLTFTLPQIHCSACIWLLENLHKLHPGVRNSRVNFLRKEAAITYDNQLIDLKSLVILLAEIGYEPELNLGKVGNSKKVLIDNKRLYQVGLAGFAFGNIMLMSLPEYFGLDADSFTMFSSWFGWVNVFLATPVMLYSGSDYFWSAWRSLKKKRLNIDVPIALGVLVLYLRSLFEIISKTGPGYYDSLCGLLFFLLLGKIFQEHTYNRLSFERDYKSYFPISVTLLRDNQEKSIPISEIKKSDRILVRNGELIPVDAVLISNEASIDYSFATGESAPVLRNSGDKIYAGGRQQGGIITIEAIKELSQSKLTRLWNDQTVGSVNKSTFSKMTDQVSQWFTPALLIIAVAAAIVQFQNGLGPAILVFSSVLIVACPCALALAAPFTFGHATRWLGNQKSYLRSASVMEELGTINHVVFDKTGTLTKGTGKQILYKGEAVSEEEQKAIKSIVRQSNHPLSKLVYDAIDTELVEVSDFKETTGKGLSASFNGVDYRIGSKKWLKGESKNDLATQVGIEINGIVKGYFEIENEYRKGLSKLLKNLSKHVKLSVLSGDNEGQKKVLSKIFPKGSALIFNQNPEEKLALVKSLKSKSYYVMMVGDGLNDAGALKESNVGVAIAEDVNAFSPACDVILDASRFKDLDKVLDFAKKCRQIVLISFGISLIYNLGGLFFAVQGLLSPVFAAILMPLSSITVVTFVSLAVWIVALRHKLT